MIEIHCEAIIFDLDGVLVNSNPIAERHWTAWAALHGLDAEKILSIHHGQPTIQTIRAVAPHLDAATEAAKKEKEEADDIDGLTRCPGALALIDVLPDSRWAIATSGTRRTARKRLGVVGLPEPAVFVTADDVKQGKPAPDPYLQAIDGLGLEPMDCLVIEDAPAGITAAKAAGAQVIGITSTNPKEKLLEADWVVDSLQDLALLLGKDGLQIRFGD